MCVCLGDAKWHFFPLCSNSSFHSPALFCRFFPIFVRWFFVNHWDFPVSIVAPKRILEQSFFLLFLSLFSFVFLCFSLSRCVCVIRPLFFVSLSLSIYLFFPSYRFSLPLSLSLSLCLLLYFSLLSMIKKTSWANSHPKKREAKTEYTKSFRQTVLEKSYIFLSVIHTITTGWVLFYSCWFRFYYHCP